MSPSAQTYITSARGMLRVWVGIIFILVPPIMVVDWFPAHEVRVWHIRIPLPESSGFISSVLDCGLALVLMALGAFVAFCETSVVIDRVEGTVAEVLRVFGKTLHRRVRRLSEFKDIDVQSEFCTAGRTYKCRTDVGVRHTSGHVIMLRVFFSSTNEPSSEVLVFVQELEKQSGLVYERPQAEKRC